MSSGNNLALESLLYLVIGWEKYLDTLTKYEHFVGSKVHWLEAARQPCFSEKALQNEDLNDASLLLPHLLSGWN